MRHSFLSNLSIKKFVPMLMIAVLLIPNSLPAQGQEKSVFDDSLQDFYIVAGTTLGGAVLGLSTLSFVEEPGDHLKNVVVGGAIGMILGVGIVAYSQATKSRDTFYQDQQGANIPVLPPPSPLKNERYFEPAKSPLWFAWKWGF